MASTIVYEPPVKDRMKPARIIMVYDASHRSTPAIRAALKRQCNFHAPAPHAPSSSSSAKTTATTSVSRIPVPREYGDGYVGRWGGGAVGRP